MKKKYEVLFYIDKLSTKKDQNDPSKMVFSTKELASHLNIQRSNLSAILNELVRENKLEKIAGRPVLYKIHNKLDEDDSIFNQLIGFNGSLAKSIQDIDYSRVIAPVVADLCTTPVALSAPPNSFQNNSQS